MNKIHAFKTVATILNTTLLITVVIYYEQYIGLLFLPYGYFAGFIQGAITPTLISHQINKRIATRKVQLNRLQIMLIAGAIYFVIVLLLYRFLFSN